MTRRRLLSLLAWLLLAATAFVTLSPIGLRPITAAPAAVERFVAYGLVGLAFALAYPRRLWLVLALVAGAAIGLELLQALAVGRHARLIDMAFKLAGGIAGIAVGALVALARAHSPGPSSSQRS